ncbi:MAG: Na/Pi cotransporter family protein [Saccharofermentans sp.]|nr:Na/Pi cotransporter family protein [Saccharofermentans sp.]
MDIFSFVTLFGGLAFFLFGMKVLSDSLKKTAGGKLESLLKKATDNPVKGLGIGALITVAIQSSSAMTVMLVGFVNSGIMELAQTVGVIFGSDIGTTLTAWILSLSGIDGGDVFILKVLKPSCFCLIFALIGVLLLMASKKQKNKDIGTMLLGFAILMQGMTMMSESMAPLKDMESFTDLLTAFNNPLLGILAGAIVTGIIQSSAASIGILQSLSMTGQLSYSVAIPLILGANIGTCATAVLSSIGVSRDAKRVTAIHVEIKIIGTIIWLIAYCFMCFVFHVPFMDEKIGVVGIAMVHSIFNISNSIILMPFRNLLVKLSRLFIKEKDEEKEFLLDERLMLTPPIAVAECRNSMKKMISKAKNGLDISTLMLLNGYNDADFETIKKNEESIDKFEDRIGTYLMKLTTTQHLSVQDKNYSSRMLQAIGEIERIADHANYLSNSSEELFEKKIEFSNEAKDELIRIVQAVRKVYTLAIDCFLSEDARGAKDIGPLRIVINEMSDVFKANHVERLASGQCTTEQGFVFNDILYSCVRIAEHSLNIAAIAYRFKNPTKENYTTYMHDFKQLKDPVSERKYKEFLDKYSSVEKASEED